MLKVLRVSDLFLYIILNIASAASLKVEISRMYKKAALLTTQGDQRTGSHSKLLHFFIFHS